MCVSATLNGWGGFEACVRFHIPSEPRRSKLTVRQLKGEKEMNDDTLMKESILLKDPKVMELAKREASAFCARHRPWGLTEEDVELHILFTIWNAEWVLLGIPDEQRRWEATVAVASSALGKARDMSKANRSSLVPPEVREAAAAQGDVDAAYVELGKKYADHYGLSDKRERDDRMEAMRAAIVLLGEKYARYCAAYIDVDADTCGSWTRVAQHFGIAPTTFARRVLPRMARLGRKVWRLVR